MRIMNSLLIDAQKDTLTKAKIAFKLQKSLGFEYAQALDFVDQFFELIRDQLAGGEEVNLSSFGKFELRQKKARPGRNPKTKEPTLIKARRVVTFKSGKKFSKTIKEKVAVVQ
jgi:integration host factor subunit alpha